VQQLRKFEFAINLQTARALGIEVRPDVLSIADEVIEQAFRTASIWGGEVTLSVRNVILAALTRCPLFPR
jgi:hypothetical protein